MHLNTKKSRKISPGLHYFQYVLLSYCADIHSHAPSIITAHATITHPHPNKIAPTPYNLTKYQDIIHTGKPISKKPATHLNFLPIIAPTYTYITNIVSSIISNPIKMASNLDIVFALASASSFFIITFVVILA